MRQSDTAEIPEEREWITQRMEKGELRDPEKIDRSVSHIFSLYRGHGYSA
ncbi:hypothetical protein [Candidatus Methylacidithermus pantelleriae]|uniref:Uncharacterized protein n=1 Tax=Candidatus Methylacidithermus pantelleriae TaxID=2744239 RepID=A0A8J2BNA8_9BACT|nr:hypothetical protein [Candidatus Methylacidithermus pantelleriae]CAF0701101.1 hypothetical protein MPNT_40137 [Candidatus Methylacidithermus pantelleriae]